MDDATTLAADAARLVELSDLQVVDGAIVGFPAPVHPRDMRRLLLEGDGGPEAQRLLRYAEAVTAHLGRLADAAADRLFGVAHEPAPETPRGCHKRVRDAVPDDDGGGEEAAARGAPRRVTHRDNAEELEAAAALSDEHPAAALRDEDFLLPVSPGDEGDGCTVYDQDDEDSAFLPIDPADHDDGYMIYGDQQHGSVTLIDEEDGQFALEAEEDFLPLDPAEDGYGQCLLPVDPTEDDDDLVYEQCGGVTRPGEAALGENEEQFELELRDFFVPLDPAKDDYVDEEDYTQFASEQEDFIPVDPTEDDDGGDGDMVYGQDGGDGDMVYGQNFDYNLLRPALDCDLEVAEDSP